LYGDEITTFFNDNEGGNDGDDDGDDGDDEVKDFGVEGSEAI
jgi:hypothetical protein